MSVSDPTACRFDARALANETLLAREEQTCVDETLRTYRESASCVRTLRAARACEGTDNTLTRCTDAQLTEICDAFLSKNYTETHAREYCAAVTEAKRAFWTKQARASADIANDA